MEINVQNLDALFIGWNGIFQKAFEAPKVTIYWEDLATAVPSETSENLYPWLGLTTAFREWLGDRALQSLEAHGFTIVNRDFENTVAVKRKSIEDDRYGVYSPVFAQLGMNARRHPDKLLFQLIKNSTANPAQVPCYDTKPFFATNHPVGKSGRATTATANIDSGGTGPYWYLLDVSRPLRPFIVQKRKEYQFVRMNTEQDEGVFMRAEYRFGVDGRLNVGVGLWQLAYASNEDLSNSSNYASALAAMKAFKTDAGEPFEAAALEGPENLKLLVPPSLEETARRLLNAEFVAGGAGGPGAAAGPISNIWRNSAGLISSPWLA